MKRWLASLAWIVLVSGCGGEPPPLECEPEADFRGYIAADLVGQMFATLHMSDANEFYGLGVKVVFAPDDLLIVHTGGITGARAVVAWSRQHRAVVAVALTGRGDAVPIAIALLQEFAVVRASDRAAAP